MSTPYFHLYQSAYWSSIETYVGTDGGGDGFGDFMFTFVTPLSALAASAGARTNNGIPIEGGTIPFPDVSATLAAEDMNLGGRG